MLSILVFVLGLSIPAVLTWGALAHRHAAQVSVSNSFSYDTHGWRFIPHEQLLKVLETSWPVLVLALLGASVSLFHFLRCKPRCYGGLVLLCALVGLIAGILVIPAAHRQYYLMPLPIACLFGAKGLCFLVALGQARARKWLFGSAALLLSVLPALALHEAFTSPNHEQLAKLHYVFDRTKPSDVVMDGWEGTGVFRPHAFYYFFLHEESVYLLPPEEVNAYLVSFESGKVRPKLIALDQNLVALGSRFVRFVKRNYVSSDGFFYFGKDSGPAVAGGVAR